MRSRNKNYLFIVAFFAVLILVSENTFAQNQNQAKIEIYPNPVISDEFSIKANQDISEVSILNVLGQEVYTQNYIGENTIKILLNTRESGLYLIQIKTADGSVTTKRVLFK